MTIRKMSKYDVLGQLRISIIQNNQEKNVNALGDDKYVKYGLDTL